MKIRNPYRNLAHWFRGNTHTHSTLSDGEWPLEKVVAFYRDRGYAFLAMTEKRSPAPFRDLMTVGNSFRSLRSPL